MSKQTRFEQQLQKLYEQREKLASQLDKAYLRGKITDYISLEEKYKEIALMIERLSSNKVHA